MRRTAVLLLFASLAFAPYSSLSTAVAAESNLGLVLDILPSVDPDIQKLTTGQSLWFLIPPGGMKDRSIRIKSSATTAEIISLSVGYLNRIDGVATIDESRKSEIEKWAAFSSNDFILAPGGVKEIRFGFNIPDDAEVGVHEAFLYAVAKPVSTKSNDEYKLVQNARIASPIFLGVGTSVQISTDFEITGIEGVVIDGVKNLRIKFRNTGRTPLHLTGNVQLSSLDFNDLNIGPLNFISSAIQPGVDAFVSVPTEEQVAPGKWKVHISATQLSKTKTRDFEVDLTFKSPNKFLLIGVRALLATAFGFILLICIRTIRKPKKEVGNISSESLKEIRKFGNFLKSKSAAGDQELDLLIEELLRKRQPTRGKKTNNEVVKRPAKRVISTSKPEKGLAKKAVAKKAVAKKAVAKKAVAKKAVAKNASAKKTVKKAPAKKAVAKKSPVKKVSKKKS